MKLLQQLITDDYRVHMQLDNLPVAIKGDRWVIFLVVSRDCRCWTAVAAFLWRECMVKRSGCLRGTNNTMPLQLAHPTPLLRLPWR